MDRVLIAGASGALGRHVVQQAKAKGLRVRVLGRDRDRLESLGADELAVADARSGGGLEAALEDLSIVFSCLGASVSPDFKAGYRSYRDVDTQANLNLIRATQAANIRNFVYVSVAKHEELKHTAYVQAHEQVVHALRRSNLSCSVLRPTGFFSAFLEIFEMAKKGAVPAFGNLDVRTNPIGNKDLATECVDEIEKLLRSQAVERLEREVGGPEVLSRKEILELAFDVLQQQPKIRMMPEAMVRLMRHAIRPFNPRVADITHFYLEVSRQDCIAPQHGTQRLREYFGSC